MVGDMASAALGDAGGGIVGNLLGGSGESDAAHATQAHSTNGPIEIVPISRLNALIVQASPNDLDRIEQLLHVLDQPNSPENVSTVAKPRLIPVYNCSADAVANVIKQVYADRLNTAGQQQRMTPADFIMAMRGGRGGRGGGNGENQQHEDEIEKMTIGVDTRNNAIVVAAADPLFNEVKLLVEELDVPSDDSQQATRVVTLKHTNPDTVKSAIVSLLGDQAITNGVQSTSSSSSSSQQNGRGQQPGGFGGNYGMRGFGGLGAAALMGGGAPGGFGGQGGGYGGRGGFGGQGGGFGGQGGGYGGRRGGGGGGQGGGGR